MKTTIQIQELKSKEDLESLMRGDKVNVELQYLKGIVTYIFDDEGTFQFIEKVCDRFLRYSIEEWNIEIRNNKIIQKHPNDYSKPMIINREEYPILYKKYNKLIGEPD